MSRAKTWTPGKIEPLNGRCYFVHDESRMTRVWDMKTRPVIEGQGWRQVTLADYTVFRKDTLKIPLKKRKEMHALLYKDKPCKSNSLPQSKPSSKSIPKTRKTLKRPSVKSSTISSKISKKSTLKTSPVRTNRLSSLTK